MRKTIVALISGSGSNLQAILDACRNGEINGDIVAVISNRPNVRGLLRAEQAGAHAITIDHKDYDSRDSFDLALAETIDSFNPDLIVLAGFMRILTSNFVERYTGRMLNIHPSLLPKYPGLNTHERALSAKDDFAGATVHFVTPELDGGPLVAQAKVAIKPDDTPLDLSKRVLAKEHLLYPKVVGWFCSERLTWDEGKVFYDQLPLLHPIDLNDTGA